MPHIVAMLAVLFFGPATSAYRGEVRLPTDLYSEAGETIAAGKYQVEVRQSGTSATLVFLSGTDAVASIASQTRSTNTNITIPVTGTTLLQPVEKAKTAADDSESRSGISPYLAPLSWNTTLRIYKSNSDSQVRAIYRNGRTVMEFPLLGARPATDSRKP